MSCRVVQIVWETAKSGRDILISELVSNREQCLLEAKKYLMKGISLLAITCKYYFNKYISLSYEKKIM